MIIVLFLAPLLLLGCISVFDRDQQFSMKENRALKQKPPLSAAALFSGEYTREFENYYSDNFPFREAFMGFSSVLGRLYYFGGGENTLIISHSGSSDLGTGESLGDIGAALGGDTATPVPEAPVITPPSGKDAPETKAPEPTPEAALDEPSEDEAVKAGNVIIIGDRAMEVSYVYDKALSRYVDALNALKANMKNIRVLSLIAPNSAEFYSPKSMHTGEASQKDMIEKAYAGMKNIICVDAYSKLKEHSGEYIYFRTDHHWTALGAYYAYTALCESLEISPVPLSDFETGRYEGFVGSMYRFTSKYPQSEALKNNPDFVDYYLPVADCEAHYYKTPDMKDGVKAEVVSTKIPEDYSNKYLCFISGDTPIFKISTSVKNGRRIAVLKESYANALVPFLTSHFEEIFVIDMRQFNGKGQPRLNLPAFADKNGLSDVLVLNYSIAPNNVFFGKMLEEYVK